MKIKDIILKYFTIQNSSLTKDELLDIQEQLSEVAEDYNLEGYSLSDKVLVLKSEIEHSLHNDQSLFPQYLDLYDASTYYIFTKESFIMFANCVVDDDYFEITDIWSEKEFIDDVIGQIEFVLDN